MCGPQCTLQNCFVHNYNFDVLEKIGSIGEFVFFQTDALSFLAFSLEHQAEQSR